VTRPLPCPCCEAAPKVGPSGNAEEGVSCPCGLNVRERWDFSLSRSLPKDTAIEARYDAMRNDARRRAIAKWNRRPTGGKDAARRGRKT